MTTHSILGASGRVPGLLGAVLTGGASRRMGTPKCDLFVAGDRLLERLCALLAERTAAVAIVGRRPCPEGLSTAWACVPDEYPALGPLGGIATALRHAASTAGPAAGVLVIACDAVALGGELLDFLLAGRNLQAAATVPVDPVSDRLEPMPGIYEAAAGPSIEESLQAGRLSISDWLARASACRLAIPPDLAPQLRGANTPQELDSLSNRLPKPRGFNAKADPMP